MRNTLKAEYGYIVKHGHTKDDQPVYHVYDGEFFFLRAFPMSYEDFADNMKGNECFQRVGVFTTKKGNQFILSYDWETDENFLTRIMK